MSTKSQFIIIIGGNRCGTTSLFNYLAAHPQINPAIEKETRFFLDSDYNIARHSALPFDNKMDTYLSFFAKKNDKDSNNWYLEGSPDYLYSPETPKRMESFFSDSKVMLIALLRDPVDRFISWFHYDKQIGNISTRMTFDEYLSANLEPDAERPYNRLDTGLYSKFLAEYKYLFGNRLFVYPFEELKRDANSLVDDIISNLGIDRDFSIAQVKSHNPSRQVRYGRINEIYNGLRRRFKNVIPQRGILHSSVKHLARVYNRLNYTKLDNKVVLSEDHKLALDAYYKDEFDAIAQYTTRRK